MLIRKLALGVALAASIGASTACLAKTAKYNPPATLTFSDGRESAVDLKQINTVLHTVGVHLDEVIIPEEAKTILNISRTKALSPWQQEKILSIFSLNRKALLKQIRQAGRKPAMDNGGSLVTQEEDVPPYPKIYDLKAMNEQNRIDAQNKFGKLHVNHAENGTGVDEVMTLVSGGPWTWFFLLKDNTVAKLTMSKVTRDGPGWRLSYPGLTPHGAFMDAKDGICVAYIHGPKIWQMRYETASDTAKMLGTNTWIDFTNEAPVLLDKPNS